MIEIIAAFCAGCLFSIGGLYSGYRFGFSIGYERGFTTKTESATSMTEILEAVGRLHSMHPGEVSAPAAQADSQ